MLAQLCTDTAERWSVSTVVANAAPETLREQKAGVQLLRAGAFGQAASVPLCPTLPLHLWRGRYDCAILHEPNPLAAAALYCRTPAKTLIIWHHSDLVRPRWAPAAYGPLQRALYRRADCVIVSSPPLARNSPAVQQARRVEVVPFGIAVENYTETTPERTAAVQKMKEMYAGPRILFVGRLVYYKGLSVLLHAIAQCEGTLSIVGEGPLEDSLRQLARDLRIESRVKFIQRVSHEDVAIHYQAADIFVLPSIARTEAFGVVQIEAMASGLPVVSTNLPTGVPWVNQHGVTGLVVTPNDPRALGRAIQQLIDDPALRARLGAAARYRAVTQFSRQRMIDDFVAVVESVVAGKPLGGTLVAPTHTHASAAT